MNAQKKELQEFSIYAVIGIVVAVVTSCFLYQRKMDSWKTEARSDFQTALQEELQKRDIINVYFCGFGNIRLSDDSIEIKKEPLKVRLQTGSGEKVFSIPYEKYINNVAESSQLRGAHSYLLHEFPLNADSLNAAWEEKLGKKGFSGKTRVRISIADWEERETYTFSGDSLPVLAADSLFSYYLGVRSEVGVTGYMGYSWLNIFTTKDKILLVAIVLCSVMLFFLQEKAFKCYLHFFLKKEVEEIFEREEVHAEIKDEETKPVAEGSGSHVYQLEEKVYFNSDLRELNKGDDFVKLSPLAAKLLKGLLEAKDNRLSNEEVLLLLWPDGTGTAKKLHTNVSRLREYLHSISKCVIVNECFGYKLITPHVSDINF